jgi:hypothetical protein
MAESQKYLNMATAEPGKDVLFLNVELDLTGSSDGTRVAGYLAFTHAFTAAPTILAVNAPNGATPLAVSAAANANGITIYGAPVSAGALFGGTVNCSAMVMGTIA